MSNPSKLYAIADQQLTSTGTSDVQTLTTNQATEYVLLSVETNSARISFGGNTPSSSNGHVLPNAALPLYLPIGRGSQIKMVSTVAGTSLLNVTEFVR